MMKTKNIFRQEEEFLKINSEIDSTTKDLMNQVNQIKEMYLEWEKKKINAENGTKKLEEDSEKKEEVYTDFDASKVSSEENFTLNNYLTKIVDQVSGSQNSESSIKSEEIETDITDEKKTKSKKNSKTIQSAKIPTALRPLNVGDDSVLHITRHKSQILLKRGLDNEPIPETLKGVGQEGIVRFLTAKVKLLTEQIEIMQKNEKKCLEKMKELQTARDKATEERDKMIQQVNMNKNVLVRYEQYNNSIGARLQTAVAENIHLKKEVENLKKEIRQNNQAYSGNEIKLNRALEEIEKLKSNQRQAKQEEKELKLSHKKTVENLTDSVKKIERQKTELLNGFKKQLLIIDNLKRQKGLIEAGKLLKTTEQDFFDFLDSKP